MAVVTVVIFLVHSSNLQTTREYPLSWHVIIYIIMYIYIYIYICEYMYAACCTRYLMCSGYVIALFYVTDTGFIR